MIELDIQQEDSKIEPVQITLSNGKVITLNDDQENALYLMREFLFDSDRGNLFYCLSGRAGAGKTTILKEALKGYKGNVSITAPTHKAKRVVSKMANYPSETIHALLGLRPDMNLEEFDTKNLLFGKSGNNKMMQYNLICIDEASMLNTSLLKEIKDCAKSMRTKILFIGDKNQLAPVKEESSPVFNDHEINLVHIDKVERQKDSNPLMKIYDEILSDLKSKTDVFSHETNLSNEEGICFFPSVNAFADKIIEVFTSDEYKRNPHSAKILCYHNDKVRQWNNYIRKILYGNFKESLKTGEILMSYTSIFDEEKSELIVENSGEYKVLNMEEGEEYYEDYDPVNKEKLPTWIKGSRTSIENLDDGYISYIFVVKNDKENYDKYLKIEQRLYKRAKESDSQHRKWNWKDYFNFRKKFLLTESIKDDGGKELVKKDFDFAYALTVHKSQGSTYRDVFVDCVDIDVVRTYSTREKPKYQDVNRLKYVAFTRPTNIAYVNA